VYLALTLAVWQELIFYNSSKGNPIQNNRIAVGINLEFMWAVLTCCQMLESDVKEKVTTSLFF